MHPTRTRLFGAVLGLILLQPPGSAAAQDQPHVNLTGTWTFTVATDAGSGTPTVTLRQQGDSLSGRYSSQFFGEADLRGRVTGREFTLRFTVSAEGQTLNVAYRGTIVSADSLEGTVSFGDLGSGTFTAKRQPPGGSLQPPRRARNPQR